MTANETRMYGLCDEALTAAAELDYKLHQVFYDLSGAGEEDIEAAEEIRKLLQKASELADAIRERMGK